MPEAGSTLAPDVARAILDGHAVVVHGNDYNGHGKYDGTTKSDLDPSLPTEATTRTSAACSPPPRSAGRDDRLRRCGPPVDRDARPRGHAAARRRGRRRVGVPGPVPDPRVRSAGRRGIAAAASALMCTVGVVGATGRVTAYPCPGRDS